MAGADTSLDPLVKRRVNRAHTVAEQQAGTKKLLKEYDRYKIYSTELVDLDWPLIGSEFRDKDEAFYYWCIQDFCIDRPFLSIGLDEDKLADIFKHDDGFKTYCKLQVGNRRSFGSFSADKKITDTSKIEAALKLLK